MTDKEKGGWRAPSHTDECPLLAHHYRLPLRGTYSKGASAGHGKWSMKCYSVLNTFLSLLCFDTHTHGHTQALRTITISNEG